MWFLVRLAVCVIGYLFGCFQTAYIFGKVFYKIDIREHGSGNAGTTNAMRVMGKKVGAITFLIDVFKGALAVFLVSIIFDNNQHVAIESLQLYTTLGAALGHNFPFYLGFRGGKGVATTAGSLLAFNYVIALIGGAIFFLLCFVTRYVSISSIALAVYFAITITIWYSSNIEVGIIAILISSLVIFRHWANIIRLIKGTENKIGSKKKVV